MKQPNNSEENFQLHDRLSAAELQTMAMRQQQQIDTQQQMLAAKEQRLRFLKSQETRSAVSMAEAERLRRLRERVEAQESKLRRLRALRGQVDLQKTYNVTLGNDLDSIRALFSEKEKELTLAVAKVEALTRQLEDLRRDRRGEAGTNGNLISFFHAQNPSNGTTSPTSKELEKLRLELAYRNQLSLQQNARLNMQKDALQQRQVELHSVDKRIIELQSRIHKKRTLNVQHYKINTNNNNSATAQQNNKLPTPVLNNLPHSRSSSAYITSSHARVLGRGNVVAVEPFNHVPVKQTSQNNGSISSFSTSLAPFDKMNSVTHVGINQTDNTQQHRQHQNQTEQQQMKRQQHYQRQMEHAIMAEVADEGIMQNADSDEKKIAARAQNLIQEQQHHKDTYSSRCSENKASKTHTAEKNTGMNSAMGKVISKELELLAQTQDYELEHNYSAKYENAQIAFAESYCDDKQELNLDCAKLGKESQPTSAAVMEIPLSIGKTHVSCNTTVVDDNSDQQVCKITHKTSGKPMKNFLQNIPLGNLVVPPRKPVNSVAPTLAMNTSIFSYSNNAAGDKKSGIARKMVSGRNVSSSNGSDKKPLNMINTRPALPPKPNKTNTNSNTNIENTSEHTVTPTECPGLDDNDAIPTSFPDVGSLNSVIKSTMSDKQPIKAKPLTIRKQPFLEQPKLRTVTGSSTSNNSGCAPVAGKLAFITTSGSAKNISHQHFQQTSKWNETFNNNSNDGNKVNFLNYDAEDDEENESVCTKKNNDDVAEASVRPTERVKSQKVAGVSAPTDEDENTVVRKKRSLVSPHTKFETPGDNLEVLTSWQAGSTTGFSDGVRHKLARRVSFDPLALLLDASLEGELELVEKTAMQVTNPSAANDEGITALHNAICAGHFEIVKFLVSFGCDVNAQDSDGWTPLHCAASCNNLPMVKFLVESGACLFASTLSDHETPAEKCEEDEEGFDGCSEYLYSIQEKLGILNNGEVFAVFSYESQQPDELSFCINDKLIIIRKGDETEREWWWARDITSKEGYVPKNLLGLQPRLAPPSCMDDKH
ncbi:apoptosis-stimulating of p53 protein 1 isoform X1 [Anopheles cruzii]|uniref:apoptosis-stimulating of p53 protein 1 isoform X1 n=1 Tax=Anopheles cruzii TaxID=68878 RepID=UPI0022EC73A1|nr:apoptosis-stimulating of p53 protein 1 isoform X1 [Anopheles cruzii]